MFIPDCQLTAFTLVTVCVLIKDIATLFCFSFFVFLPLSFCLLFTLFATPYLEVSAGLVSEGQVECCVLSVCTLYKLSSISLCSGRTICLLLSVGRDRLNGMGWSLQDPLSPPNYYRQRTGLWLMVGVDKMMAV